MLPMTLANLKRVTTIMIRQSDGCLSMSVDPVTDGDSRINVGPSLESPDDRTLGFENRASVRFVIDLMEAITGQRFDRCQFEAEGNAIYKRRE